MFYSDFGPNIRPEDLSDDEEWVNTSEPARDGVEAEAVTERVKQIVAEGQKQQGDSHQSGAIWWSILELMQVAPHVGQIWNEF